MFENLPQSFSREALDESWYAQFEKIGGFQAYEYLDGDRQKRELEKQAFLIGEKENPDLDYPLLNIEDIARREEALLNLKNLVLGGEKNEVVKQVYRWKIKRKNCRKSITESYGYSGSAEI